MSLTETDICNSALIKVGAERIISLNDETEAARLCKEQYPKMRDELLRSHPWNFAIDRKALAADPIAPVYGFSNRFQIPGDYLRVLDVWTNRCTWQREGEFILTDSGDVSIRYIKKITDVSKYDANFAEALAAKLAADICYSLVQTSSLKELLLKEAEMKLRTARSFDAQEGTPQQVIADDFITARFGGGLPGSWAGI